MLQDGVPFLARDLPFGGSELPSLTPVRVSCLPLLAGLVGWGVGTIYYNRRLIKVLSKCHLSFTDRKRL